MADATVSGVPIHNRKEQTNNAVAVAPRPYYWHRWRGLTKHTKVEFRPTGLQYLAASAA